MVYIHILIGLVLLFLGRRLFWLFVACVGFTGGYLCFQQIWAVHSPMTVLILSITAGVLGAVIAIFFQKAAIVSAGFVAGGYVFLSLFDQFAGFPAQMIWLPSIIGGIIGAVILLLVFDWALIFLSTLTGAALIVQLTVLNPLIEIAIFLTLVIVGIAFQAKIMRDSAKGKKEQLLRT